MKLICNRISFYILFLFVKQLVFVRNSSNRTGSNEGIGCLRIIGHTNEVYFYYSADLGEWRMFERSIKASAFNCIVLGELLSLRAGLLEIGTYYQPDNQKINEKRIY